ncbi:phosphate ABC transporter permease PstA [Tahibacter soli]|uniref:Phosphate transport system permease protein PstA n=1 Tax=Tahibacter soli TaxID=2983605 RepID=A0A9X4BG42_9GAMM|nr:phosphate ABC transporter permease PstA [Tahibacter soli]MDC8012180.1 phosphate ABC transporter permease PstA [Tahibacter soli]
MARARNARRTDAAGLWLAAAGIAISLAALVGLVALLASQALSGFAVRPIEEIRWREVDIVRQELAALVADDGAHLVVRGSETERAGGAYRRVALADVVSRERPRDAVSLRLADGRELVARGDVAAWLALENAATIAAPGLPPGLRRADVVEAIAPNALGLGARAAVVASRAWQFVAGDERRDDGLFAALVGTVVLVFAMSILVMPLGVLAALWLHEYAGDGIGARAIRAAVANLAGVPAVIYGLFGLVLFVHTVGANLDAWLFADALPSPTFGSGGLMWASMTLALLTLPVVVTATEEGLARVPQGLRQAALALGATRAELIRRVVLPVARPALLTGLILAIARAAGEVAPLMLVGVVKYAPALPVDGEFPYLHASRQFMHLGYTVYDRALAGGDALRSTPQAYAAALLLVAVVAILNLSAIVVRNRLRESTRGLA